MVFRRFRDIYPGREFSASAIQAENYYYNSLDSGCGKFSAWINGAKPMKNHRKSNVFVTLRIQWNNWFLLTKRAVLYNIALTACD